MTAPYMTVEYLKTFNDSVIKDKILSKKQKPIQSEIENTKKKKENEPLFDPNEYDSFIVAPDKLDDQLLYGLVDLIDNKISSYTNNNIQQSENSPNIVDIIMDSLAVAYITDEGIPIATCILIDPTKEDYRGQIPADYYEIKTGMPLTNRIKQEFFVVHPDYHDIGMAGELRRLISTIAPHTFTVVPSIDTPTNMGLSDAGYDMESTFDDNGVESHLWINK